MEGAGFSRNRSCNDDQTVETMSGDLRKRKPEKQSSSSNVDSSLQEQKLPVIPGSTYFSGPSVIPAQQMTSDNLELIRFMESKLQMQEEASNIGSYEVPAMSIGRGTQRQRGAESKLVQPPQQVQQGVPSLIKPVAERSQGLWNFSGSSSNVHLSRQENYFSSGLAKSNFEKCLASDNTLGIIDPVKGDIASTINTFPLYRTEENAFSKARESSMYDSKLKNVMQIPIGLEKCSIKEKVPQGLCSVKNSLTAEIPSQPIPVVGLKNLARADCLETNLIATELPTDTKKVRFAENRTSIVDTSLDSNIAVHKKVTTPCLTVATGTPLFVTRPSHILSKKGSTGTQISLMSNYFKLCAANEWVVYQYHVEFSPHKEDISIRKKILKVHKEKLGSSIYDGNLLYSSKQYPINPLVLKAATRTESVTITISLQGKLNPQDANYMWLFNCLVRKCMSALKLRLLGINYYDPKAKLSLSVDRNGSSWELWPGFMISIRQHEQDVLLCAEITHKLIRNDTALDLLNSIRINKGNNARNAVRGLEVLTAYNNRTYYISDIDFDATPQTTFTLQNEKTMTFASYYKEKYNLRVVDANQPMLISKFKSRCDESIQTIYLVPELCQIVGLSQDWMKRDMFLYRAIAERTNFEPLVHIQKIKDFITRVIKETATAEVLKGWNMELEANMTQFQGRVLPAEKIILGPGSGKKSVQFDWTPDLHSATFLNSVTLKSWCVLAPIEMHEEVKSFIRSMQKTAKELGMKIDDPRVIGLSDDSVSCFNSQLDKLLLKDKPQLICCFLRTRGEERYNAIKRKCCLDRAVATQVIVKKSIENHWDKPICRRLIMQINCKIGGTPWSVEIPLQGLMVVGIDICRDSQNNGIFYCALVASINGTFSRFFSAAAPYRTDEDRSDVLSGLLTKAIQKFSQRNNNKLPSHIVVYRNGAGKRDIPFIHENEVTQFQSALCKLYGTQQWRLGYIVVSTYANTRIFTENGYNPPTGTVVDDCITRPERYDFFLVTTPTFQRSQTSYPTMYNVLFDNTGLQPDKIQRLTYKLNHLYYNVKGIIRTPAPVRYAQRLVQMVALHLHRAPHQDLSELLYFL